MQRVKCYYSIIIIGLKDHRIQLSLWDKKIESLTHENPEIDKKQRKIRVRNVEIKTIIDNIGKEFNEGSTNKELKIKANTKFSVFGDINLYDLSYLSFAKFDNLIRKKLTNFKGVVTIIGDLNAYEK